MVDDAGPWPNFWERFTPAYAAELTAFLTVVAEGGESPCPVTEALAALRIAEAADESRRSGGRILVRS